MVSIPKETRTRLHEIPGATYSKAIMAGTDILERQYLTKMRRKLFRNAAKPEPEDPAAETIRRETR